MLSAMPSKNETKPSYRELETMGTRRRSCVSPPSDLSTVPGNTHVFEVRPTPKNLGGHVTLARPLFRKIFKLSCPDCPRNMHVKFEVGGALTVLELLAFNTQKFRGSCPLFEKFLMDRVRTVPGNMHVKFELRSFNRFKLV